MYTELSSGLSQATVCDEQITIYRLTNMHRETVDVWIDAIKKQIQHSIDNDIPLVTLNHFDGAGVGPTPYSAARGKEVTALMPDLEGYTAFVMERNTRTIEMQIAMRRSMARTRQRSIFFDFDEAMDWLKTHIKNPCTDDT